MKTDHPRSSPQGRSGTKRLSRVEHIILLTFGATIMAVVAAALHLS